MVKELSYEEKHMGITYSSVRKILAEKNIEYPDLNVFNQRGIAFKVAQWQPMSEIHFNQKKGFYTENKSHYGKAESFLKRSLEENADIIVTPEYSCPWEILNQILFSREMEVDYGKLFCLGMEGISLANFKLFEERCHSEKDVEIIVEDFSIISKRDFLSCLVYIFSVRGKVICLVQLKTTAASDKWVQLEANGLMTGNTIYYFDDYDGKNCLIAIICADALSQVTNLFTEKLNYNKYLVLHPQLNPKPLHESFMQLRSNLINFAYGNIRILTQNWSENSRLITEDNNEIKIENSYSACYYCENEINEVFDELYIKNKGKGIDLCKDDHILIWHMPENEHCMIYCIDSFDSNGINPVSGNHKEPLGFMYMEYSDESGEWEGISACKACSIDWNWLNEQFKLKPCNNGYCEVVKLHRFFSILFAKNMYESLNVKNNFSQVVFNKMQNDSQEEIYKQRERSNYVNQALEKEIFPPKFAELKNHNYRWVLKERGNLEALNGEYEKEISIVYIDSGTDYSIQKGIMTFKKLMGAYGTECMDRMILYYWSGEGIKYYDKFYNTEINNPDIVHSVGAINKGDQICN